MSFSTHPRRRPSSQGVAVLIALALMMAACTASTTIQSVESPPASAADAASDVSPAETPTAEPTAVPAPPTPRPAIDDGAQDSSAEDQGQATPPPDPTGPPADVATDQLPSGTTQVVLLDPGAEPRVELRLMIAASCGEIMTVNQTQEITQELEGLPLPGGGAVGTVVEMATSAARIGDNYNVQSEIIAAYASPDMAPDIAASLNVELERLVGIATFATMTDRGVQLPDTYRVEGAEVLGPLQSAVESIAQVQAPLPVEAVGVGARWETTSVIDFEGAPLTTITEYLVTGLEGTLVDMQVSATQSVSVGSEMDMQGLAVEVVEWSGLSQGETTLDMATISPIRSVSTTTGTQSLDFGAEGGLLTQELEGGVTITSEPDEGCTGRTTRP